jgi:hypothetical protein
VLTRFKNLSKRWGERLSSPGIARLDVLSSD